MDEARVFIRFQRPTIEIETVSNTERQEMSDAWLDPRPAERLQRLVLQTVVTYFCAPGIVHAVTVFALILQPGGELEPSDHVRIPMVK